MSQLIPVRVLLIDDDPAVRRNVGQWLREDGCDLVAAADANEGQTLLTTQDFHAVLVDLHLPDGGGTAAIQTARRTGAGTRVIALGAFPEAREVIAVIRDGAHDFLEKPLNPVMLRTALERQLAERGVLARTEAEFNRRLGARLRLVRTGAGRTLADVAEGCGLTAAQLSQIELGKSATSTWTLARICAALRTPLITIIREL